VFLAGAAQLRYEEDELFAAACLAGRPLDVRPCRHIGLHVPSSAEIVIEGRILPNVRRPEGPYGDFMGYYAPRADRHVFQIDGVCWREQALFHGILGASPEELETLQLALATKIYRHLAAVVPGIVDVSCIGSLAQTVVQIRQQYEGHARQVALMAFGADPRWTKVCTVVDEDVDIHDLADVAWAQAVRVAPERDVLVIPGVPGHRRDPVRKHWGRLAITATVPFGREKEFERKRIPGAESVRLADYGIGHSTATASCRSS
jgi:UbiD family decarboxylase